MTTDSIGEFQSAAADASANLAALKVAAVHQRWSVKTAADVFALQLVSQAPTATTVGALVKLPVPPTPLGDGRSDAAEKTKFQLTATLTGYKLESDGDYHLVIEDAQHNTRSPRYQIRRRSRHPATLHLRLQAPRAAFEKQFRLQNAPPPPTAPTVPPTIENALTLSRLVPVSAK